MKRHDWQDLGEPSDRLGWLERPGGADLLGPWDRSDRMDRINRLNRLSRLSRLQRPETERE